MRRGLLPCSAMRLSVIVPMYNERSTIRECLQRVLDAPFDKEIIVVDDASTDDSVRVVETVASEYVASTRGWCCARCTSGR